MSPSASRFSLRAALLVLGAFHAAPAAAFPPAPAFDLNWLTQANGYRVQAVRQPDSPHYFPPLLAARAAAILDTTRAPVFGDPGSVHQAHWLQGFRAPWFLGGERLVQFYDCYRPDAPNAGCGGGFALPERIVMPAPEYRSIPESCTRMVLSHELFHHIQFGYAARAGGEGCDWIGATACEGMARAMQDKLYLDLDRDPDASCFAGYHEEVGSYLDDPNRNLWDSGYASALWWNYLSEQFGEETEEPQRGVDFFVRWLDLAEAAGAQPDPLTVTRQTIQQTAPTASTQGVFQNFLLANRIKGLDLGSTADAFRLRYSYRDEETAPGTPAPEPYPLPARAQRVVAPDAPGLFAFDARAFAAQYVDWDVSQCPSGALLRWETRPDSQGQALPSHTLTGLVAVRGELPGRPVRLYKNRSRGWTKSLLQPAQPFDRLLSVVAGWSAGTRGELRLSCTPSPSAPALPLASPLRPFTPGPPDRLSVVEVPVALDPIPHAPPSRPGGLSIDDFLLQVGERPAEVLAALPEGDGYRLQVALPRQESAGRYPLRLRHGEREVAVPDAVHYAPLAPQLLLAVDTSASMVRSGDNALDALKAALPVLIDGLPDSARVGLLDHGEGAAPQAALHAPLAPLQEAQRRRLALALASLSERRGAGAALGDALRQSIAAFEQDAQAVPARHVLLIVDGSQGPGPDWEEVRHAVLDAGIAVHALALGPRADQPLLDRIARESRGSYRYVERAQGVDHGELADTLLEIGERISRRLRIAAEGQLVPTPGQTLSYALEVPVLLDPPADAGLQLSLFAADARAASVQSVALRDPEGRVRAPGSAGTQIHQDAARWSISTPYQGGRWTLQVNASSAAPASTHRLVASLFGGSQGALNMHFQRHSRAALVDSLGIGDSGRVAVALLLPAVQQVREAASIQQAGPAGSPRQKGLLLPAVQKVREAGGRVRHPDGRIDRLALQPAAEDGSGQFEDSVWAADYRRLTAGAPSGRAEDPATSGQRGSYRVELGFRFPQPSGASWQVLARHDFALRGDAPADAEGDGLPDAYEAAFGCLDPAQPDAALDPDEDGLSSRREYALGTHPCLADSDEGGEADGSEVAAGREPLWPDDDALCPLQFAHAEDSSPDHGDTRIQSAAGPLIALRFTTCPRNTRIEVRRAEGASGMPLPYAQIDPLQQRGVWVDHDVQAGQRYRYQLVAYSERASGPPSAEIEARARMRASLPSGTLQLNQGRPRTDDALLRVSLASRISLQPGSLMRLAVDEGEFGPWQPLVGESLLAVAAADRTRRVRVTAQLSDAEGARSAPFSDSIVLHPAASLANLQARVTRAGGSAARGALLWLPDARHEAQSVADAQGQARLTDLPPGRHRLQLAADDAAPRTLWVQLSPGQTLDLGEQGMDPGQLDFVDGFE